MEDLDKIYEEGCELYEKEDYVAAVEKFRYAAERGYADAQNSLSDCYYDGEGVEKDVAEAIKWAKLAAEQGCLNAQEWLGRIYRNGEDEVEKDETEATKWYKMAFQQVEEEANKGSFSAQIKMVAYYTEGQCVKIDVAKAKEWYGWAKKSSKNFPKTGLCGTGKNDHTRESAKYVLGEAKRWIKLAKMK